jgi:hypothetical protein
MIFDAPSPPNPGETRAWLAQRDTPPARENLDRSDLWVCELTGPGATS